MLLYPNAKINIGLNITNKLKSGYHVIESSFCPVSLYDIIEIKESNRNNLSISGIKIDGKKSNNIVSRAINTFNSDKKFNIHLHKNIPIGAGLGGGSSDGSSILKFLNNKYPKYDQEKLLSESNKIGSDCPFFIYNKIKYVTGTQDFVNGETVTKWMRDYNGRLYELNITVCTYDDDTSTFRLLMMMMSMLIIMIMMILLMMIMIITMVWPGPDRSGLGPVRVRSGSGDIIYFFMLFGFFKKF